MAIYLIAAAFGLVLFVVPVLLANGPTKFDNPGLAAYDPPPGTVLIPQRARNSFPLAFLRHEEIVDPALVAELNAKAKKAEKSHHLASRTGQSVRPEAPSQNTRYAQPANSGRSFFSLF